MLLANRKVAEFIGKQEKTFIYRVHDEPDEEKLMLLQGIISRFGYGHNMKNRKTITSSLNTLLSDVQGKKEQNLVDTLAIRSMSKAKYTTDNIGHYGLAFDYPAPWRPAFCHGQPGRRHGRSSGSAGPKSGFLFPIHLRTRGLQGTAWSRAQFDQIQLRVLKVGPRIEEFKTKIRFHFPSSFPLKEVYAKVLSNLSNLELCRSP